MIFEYFSLILGIVKVLFYKILYFNRISFKDIPKMNNSFKIAIKKKSKLEIGKKFRTRNNISIRIYDLGKVKIGNNCFLNDNCSINCQDEIVIGDNVICGQNVMFFDHDHDYRNNIKNFVKKKITIGNNVWIGANCIVLKGVSIGDNVVVGAGSVIKGDIKSNTLYYEKKERIERGL